MIVRNFEDPIVDHSNFDIPQQKGTRKNGTLPDSLDKHMEWCLIQEDRLHKVDLG